MSTTLRAKQYWIQNQKLMLPIIGLIAVLRFINLGFVDLQPWDEPLYAIRAEAAIRFGDWLDQTPHSIGGLYSGLHPPFYVWCTAAAYKVFGINEFSTRFFSALFGAGTIFLVFCLGRQIYDKRTGFAASLLLGLNPFYTFWTRQGQLDATLTFFLTLAFLSVVQMATGNRRKWFWIVMTGTAIGFALMTKLFIGLFVPLICILSVAVFDRANLKQSFLNVLVATSIGLVLALPWHLMMTIKHGGGNLFFFLSQSGMIDRTLFGIEGNVKELGWLYYINQLVIAIPYAVVFLVYGMYETLKKHSATFELAGTGHMSGDGQSDRFRRGRILSRRIMVAWFMTLFLVFTIMRTKLSVYLVPMLVPLSVIAGSVVSSISHEENDRMSYGISRVRSYLRKNKILILSISTLAFVIWAASSSWRSALKNSVRAIFGSGSIDSGDTSKALLLAGLILVSGVILAFVHRKGLLQSVLGRHLVPAIAIPVFLVFSFDILVLDSSRFDDGGQALCEFMRSKDCENIIAVGNGVNPQLTYYLDGVDIGWASEKNFERLEPKNGIERVKNYLSEKKARNLCVIVEKDEMLLGSYGSAEEIVPSEYTKAFEGRGYSVFVR